ncbi:uncharacterized protein LOC141580798 [Saimiri boliviensis]|uniref:uncharacterized protein LOC141580798 n=1 Tax=Saimiri boliviensis TaxID=27679 RepID=UPI003D774520
MCLRRRGARGSALAILPRSRASCIAVARRGLGAAGSAPAPALAAASGSPTRLGRPCARPGDRSAVRAHLPPRDPLDAPRPELSLTCCSRLFVPTQGRGHLSAWPGPAGSPGSGARAWAVGREEARRAGSAAAPRWASRSGPGAHPGERRRSRLPRAAARAAAAEHAAQGRPRPSGLRGGPAARACRAEQPRASGGGGGMQGGPE